MAGADGDEVDQKALPFSPDREQVRVKSVLDLGQELCDLGAIT